jgi:hypothetical protein
VPNIRLESLLASAAQERAESERPSRIGGGRVEVVPLLVLSAVWILASMGTGYILARLAKRIHPSLSLPKLWLFYTGLMAALVALVFIIGWF